MLTSVIHFSTCPGTSILSLIYCAKRLCKLQKFSLSINFFFISSPSFIKSKTTIGQCSLVTPWTYKTPVFTSLTAESYNLGNGKLFYLQQK